VGKSSLLNLLLGHERAIVSSRPGTTRDVIEEVINLGGYPLRLIDTAGVRESDDDIEVEGIHRTLRQVDRADLVLHLLDGSAERVPVSAGHLLVLNKSDLGIHPTWDGVSAVRISCLNNQGLEDLEVAILKRITSGQLGERDWTVAINARHQSCLVEALEFGAAAELLLVANQPPELVAEELRGALSWIGQVVGEVDNEEILGKIFGTFCIGK
jgi:tRNA modification GTPase